MIERLRLDGKLPDPISHYTDAVRADSTVWISGLLPVDANGTLVGGDDAAAQAEQVLANLALVLDATKASFADVVKVGVYVRRIGDREAIDQARQRRFGNARPASTLVEVSALAHPDALVEIDAVVHLPSST
jgi:2-iminobutanoate/2-iminopropanoate deaminase